MKRKGRRSIESESKKEDAGCTTYKYVIEDGAYYKLKDETLLAYNAIRCADLEKIRRFLDEGKFCFDVLEDGMYSYSLELYSDVNSKLADDLFACEAKRRLLFLEREELDKEALKGVETKTKRRI